MSSADSQPDSLLALTAGSYAASRTFVADLAGGDELSDIDVEACRIEGGVAQKSVWRRCTLDRCVITGVNLSMTKFIDTRFSECTISDSKAQAVSWNGLRPSGLAERSISFERCRLDYGSFMGMDARGLGFRGCSLVDADFSEADCRGVEFIDCDLSGARFAETDLREALFVDVRGLSVDVRDNRTDGMQVDVGAALDLVSAMRIEIVSVEDGRKRR